MQPIGYLYKRVAKRPAVLKAPQVDDVYSLSGCISKNFADYIQYWKHNGYWLFDSPAVIEKLAADHAISLAGMKLFYYEAYEKEYDEARQAVESGSFQGLEPGPYRIIAVYTTE